MHANKQDLAFGIWLNELSPFSFWISDFLGARAFPNGNDFSDWKWK